MQLKYKEKYSSKRNNKYHPIMISKIKRLNKTRLERGAIIANEEWRLLYTIPALLHKIINQN
jgi:hypothetical protein